MAKAFVIAFLSQKGGNGKTTLSVMLAVELMLRGLRVAILDTDPHGGTVTWANRADARNRLRPFVHRVDVNLDPFDPKYPEEIARATVEGIQLLAEKFDVVLVDTSGGMTLASTGAAACADLVITPYLPSFNDLNPLQLTLDALAPIQAARPQCAVGIVINQWSKQPTSLNRAMHAAAHTLPVGCFSTEIGRYTHLPEAYALGEGVTVRYPKSLSAAQIRALTDEVQAKLKEART